MKKLINVLAAVFITASVFAQAPQKMSFQAVIRNSSNVLVTSTTVGMQISILQSSITGTPVYVETQTPTTNANGLASLEIGAGLLVSGTFATIDWANGLYFIKTETDPTGGTNYTIMGTSQLLSVPYALHSNTAESITGGITETDPFFETSPANGITSVLIDNWNTTYTWGNHTGLYQPIGYVPSWSEITSNPFLFSTLATDQLLKYNGTNWENFTPDFAITTHSHSDATTTESGFMSGTDKTKLDGLQNADGSETKVTTGTNIIVTGAGTAGNPYIINNVTHYIGENYGGGIVFYVNDNGQHGLLAATTDQSTAMQWYNGTNSTINAVRDGIGGGMYNTERIISNQGAGNYAAQLCANYKGGNYGDWYLPSKYELNLMYTNLHLAGLGGFNDNPYWSSSESDNLWAWLQPFFNGSQILTGKDNPYYVRAVRAF